MHSIPLLLSQFNCETWHSSQWTINIWIESNSTSVTSILTRKTAKNYTKRKTFPRNWKLCICVWKTISRSTTCTNINDSWFFFLKYYRQISPCPCSFATQINDFVLCCQQSIANKRQWKFCITKEMKGKKEKFGMFDTQKFLWSWK